MPHNPTAPTFLSKDCLFLIAPSHPKPLPSLTGSRITPVSRSVIRLCIYEMLYMNDIPVAVSLNEAIELVKKFDDEKMRPFVNGLLNGVKNEIEAAKEQ